MYLLLPVIVYEDQLTTFSICLTRSWVTSCIYTSQKQHSRKTQVAQQNNTISIQDAVVDGRLRPRCRQPAN